MYKFFARNKFLLENLNKYSNRNILTYFSNDSNIVTCNFSDVEIPNVTVQEFFSNYHVKYEQFCAIECCSTKRKYTYGDLRARSTNLSKAFKKIFNMNDGNVVAIVLSNVPEYPIANLGILKANLTTTTISPMFTPEEISRQLLDSDAKIVITEVELTSTVKKAIHLTRKNLPILSVKTNPDQLLPENTINFHEIVETEFDYPEIVPCDPENVAFLPYSSGTTGLPKGVALTHRNLVANMMQNSHPELRFKREASGNFQEVLPTILPLYHAFGYSVVMNGITQYGGKIVTLPKFKRNLYVSMLRDYQESTILYLVPPIVLMLIGDESIKKEYLRNVRVIFCGAAPLTASDEGRLLNKFGDDITILQGYGLTETSPVVTSLYPKLLETKSRYDRGGSIGRPVPNTRVKIVDINDEKNVPLGPNAPGELLVKGPQVMKGYHNLPNETAKMLTEDGWLRTGDVGYYNEDGFFFISDRFKELIKVKGNQVPPAELEAIIREFKGVQDVAVIGIPHETSGEVPRAYVVPMPKIEKFDTNALDDFVTGRVAKYKRLKGGIVLVDDIPKNASGKILRRKIKEQFLKYGI